MIGIIALSWGLGGKEDPCNHRLAREVDRFVQEELECGRRVVVIAQAEVARHMLTKPDLVISAHRRKGEYLGSEEVVAQATEFLQTWWVDEIVVVANPFLHLAKCRKLVRVEGFTIIDRKIGRIGFYCHDRQFLPRSPIHTVLYGLGQFLFGLHGRPF